MDTIMKEKKRTKTLKEHEVYHADRIHRNCIRVGRNESYAHANKKFDICWEFLQLEQAFITEPKIRSKGRRYDILNLDTGDIVEIESDKSVKKKDADIIIYLEDD